MGHGIVHEYGFPPLNANQPIPVARAVLFGGLTLTKISGGSTRWNAMSTNDTVTSITVGGTEILGSTITYATSVAATCKTAIKVINAYNSPYWATFDGTDVINIWPRDGRTADTGAVVTTESGFTATDVNMNTGVAFVAAVRWPSLNLGDDAFADTGMYRVGFDFSTLRSLDSEYDLTSAKGVELVLTTEDQVLDVYIGAEGKLQLSTTSPTNTVTLEVLAAAQNHLSIFLQSGAAQNPTHRVRIW